MDRDDLSKAYSPPGSDVNAGLFQAPQDVVLADRLVRLLAVTLDGLLVCIPFLPMLAIGIYMLASIRGPFLHASGEPGAPVLPGFSDGQVAALLGGGFGIGMLGFLGIAIYQWVLISKTGQSLGKKWTGIRIERLDGKGVDFTSGVFLRNWVPKMVGMIPYLGSLFHLVDVVFIFRQDRRCVHDHMAGTRVVRLER
jgi:uncharacterized RDD family membrane protein YckC